MKILKFNLSLVYLTNTLKIVIKKIKNFLFRRVIKVKNLWLRSESLYDFLIKFIIFYAKETKIGIYFLKFNVKLVSFCTNTWLGYILYVFAVFYGLSDMVSNIASKPPHFLLFFSSYVVITSMEMCILVYLPATSRVISSLITEDSLVKHLGNKTGISNFIKAISPFLIFCVLTDWSITESRNNIEKIYQIDVAALEKAFPNRHCEGADRLRNLLKN